MKKLILAVLMIASFLLWAELIYAQMVHCFGPPGSGTIYADWTGIDAMSTGSLSAGRIGSTLWEVIIGSGDTASIVDSSIPVAALP